MKFTFKQFIIKLLIFGSPIWFLIISYILFDPFHIIYSYDAYGSNFLKTYNRNRISTETFLRNNQKYNFSSFGRDLYFLFQTYQKNESVDTVHQERPYNLIFFHMGYHIHI